MSVIQILGQDDQPAPATPPAPAELYGRLQAYWDEAFDLCAERFGEGPCHRLLGYGPTILEEKKISWYYWLIGGVLIGKVIL